jgi:hypothetical protein
LKKWTHFGEGDIRTSIHIYRGADKFLAQPTFRCILFDGENISFDPSLVIYINSTNTPPIMIISRVYEHQTLPSLQLFSFLVGLRTYQHPYIISCTIKRISPKCYGGTYTAYISSCLILVNFSPVVEKPQSP